MRWGWLIGWLEVDGWIVIGMLINVLVRAINFEQDPGYMMIWEVNGSGRGYVSK